MTGTTGRRAPDPGRTTRLPALVGLVAVLVAWEAAVRVARIDPLVLPSPTRVLSALAAAPDEALRHTLPTLVETAAGFSLSVALAFGAALAMDRVGAIRRAVYPLLVASQTIPIVALAPLLIIWFGFGLLPKVLVIVLVTFFPIVVALLDGLAATDPDALDLLDAMGATEGQALRTVRLPAALPAFFTGLRISITYAVVGAVFAEYVGAYEGLGIWMQLARNAYRTDLVFGAIAITALLSVALFGLVLLVERLVIPWHRDRLSAR